VRRPAGRMATVARRTASSRRRLGRLGRTPFLGVPVDAARKPVPRTRRATRLRRRLRRSLPDPAAVSAGIDRADPMVARRGGARDQRRRLRSAGRGAKARGARNDSKGERMHWVQLAIAIVAEVVATSALKAIDGL